MSPGTPKTEEYLRTAIGRAYYAAHLTARETLLAKRKVKPNKKGLIPHGEVIDALKLGPLPSVGDKLHQLGKMREVADYTVTSQIQLTDAQVAKALVTEIISKLPNAV
ncbi:MAG: hypothetical protein JRN38_07160 [Nitrososphaerota archaeon]|nr:hypothetical protein [Nitrososphaerota archaeon]